MKGLRLHLWGLSWFLVFRMMPSYVIGWLFDFVFKCHAIVITSQEDVISDDLFVGLIGIVLIYLHQKAKNRKIKFIN